MQSTFDQGLQGPVHSGRRRFGRLVGGSAFVRGAGVLFSAQILSRLARLGTTLAVARLLAPEHFGVVAIAMATHEMALVIARFATSPALVRCEQDQLSASCRAAWTLNWSIGIGLFVAQALAAIPIALLYRSPEVAAPIMVLALTYLLLPLGAVHQGLTLRRGDMKSVADAEVRQAVCDATLSIALALCGFGLWSLILPKLLVVPLWIRVHRRASPWRPSGFSLEGAGDLARFGGGVVGVELLNTLRHNIDYLLVGLALGVEALGLYFFAFNAGLGITRGLLTALNSALLPSLCRGEPAGMNRRFLEGGALTLGIVTCWVALQTGFASLYVPIVFGDRWVTDGALPVLVLIALCGIPMAIIESCAQYLRARGLAARDLRWNGLYSIGFTLAVVAGLPWGVVGVASAVLLVNVINLPLYLHFNIAPVLSRQGTDRPDEKTENPRSLP